MQDHSLCGVSSRPATGQRTYVGRPAVPPVRGIQSEAMDDLEQLADKHTEVRKQEQLDGDGDLGCPVAVMELLLSNKAAKK